MSVLKNFLIYSVLAFLFLSSSVASAKSTDGLVHIGVIFVGTTSYNHPDFYKFENSKLNDKFQEATPRKYIFESGDKINSACMEFMAKKGMLGMRKILYSDMADFAEFAKRKGFGRVLFLKQRTLTHNTIKSDSQNVTHRILFGKTYPYKITVIFEVEGDLYNGSELIGRYTGYAEDTGRYENDDKKTFITNEVFKKCMSDLGNKIFEDLNKK